MKERILDYLFIAVVVSFFWVLALVVHNSSASTSACECSEWLNQDQDIKCIVRRDTRKYGHKGRE